MASGQFVPPIRCQLSSVKDRQGFKSLANSESPLKRTTNSASNSRIHPTLSISTGIDSRADVVDTYPNSIAPTPTNLFSRDFPSLASANGIFANVTSGVSVPVPEPSHLADLAVVVLGAIGITKKKIAAS